jgi:hypothetical protein
MQFKHISAIAIVTIGMWISLSALSTCISGPRRENLPALPLSVY